MKGSRCGRGVSPLLAAALLLLLLLPPPPPGRAGAWASLLQAAAPGPAAPGTSPPLRPGPTAAGSPGRAPADAAGPRGAEGGNGSSPRAGLAADDSGGKAREEDSAGGSLAVSPNPGDKPMTQRALTVLMVVSGAVLVYFVVRTVRMRRRNRKTRRYGVLDTNIENMELTPLEQDDEDDDNTLFDASHPRR